MIQMLSIYAVLSFHSEGSPAVMKLDQVKNIGSSVKYGRASQKK